MKKFFKDKFDYIFLILLITCYISLFLPYINNGYVGGVGGDGISMYYPAVKILEDNSLNFWNDYNTMYQTYYFTLGFSDIAIKSIGEIYPMQPSSLILYYSYFMGFLGNNAFYYFNFMSSIIIIIVSFLTLKELYNNNRKIVYPGTIIISLTPLLIIWSLVPQDILLPTALLLISIYYLVKYDKTENINYWYLSLFFLFYSLLLRAIFVLFILGYIIYLLKGTKNDITKKIGSGIIILFFTFLFFPLSNLLYFGDWSFLGYLHTDYHPNPIGYEDYDELIIDRRLSNLNTNFVGIIKGILYFISGSIKYFLPIVFIFFISLFSKFKNKRFVYFSIIVVSINLLYYGNVKSLLWGDGGYNLGMAFFRYLLPVNILLIYFIPNVLNKLSKINILLFTSLFFTVYSVYTYSYSGGGSLSYIKEINYKISDFGNNINGILPVGSTILYAERTPQYYLSPNIFDYNWFQYYSVPPNVRFIHTQEIVNKLLRDGKNVYFASFEAPYDGVTKDMEVFLRQRFGFEFVNGTEFKRQKFKFYKIYSIK